jgi:hypothetical protein
MHMNYVAPSQHMLSDRPDTGRGGWGLELGASLYEFGAGHMVFGPGVPHNMCWRYDVGVLAARDRCSSPGVLHSPG